MQSTLHKIKPNKSGVYRCNFGGEIFLVKSEDKTLTETSIVRGKNFRKEYKEFMAGEATFFNHFVNQN